MFSSCPPEESLELFRIKDETSEDDDDDTKSERRPRVAEGGQHGLLAADRQPGSGAPDQSPHDRLRNCVEMSPRPPRAAHDTQTRRT